MKTKVIVTLVASTEVEIEVEHEADESPTDLTKADIQKARSSADVDWRWDVTDVVEVSK